MKLLFLILIVLVGQVSYSQNSISILSAANIPKSAQYDLQLIDKKLKTSRNCIISGSVLTAVGGAVFTAGCFLLLPGKQSTPPPEHIVPNYGPVILWIASIPALVPGITVLSVGLSEKHKWKKIKNGAVLTGELLPGNKVGLTLAF